MASAPYFFLLVAKPTETQWPAILEHALSPLGKLHVVSEEEVIRAVSEHTYDVILIDAGAVQDVIRLIVRLRSRQPKARIVVVTASPTWQQSREVFRAGAADYIRKSLDRKRLRAQIQSVLEATPLLIQDAEEE